MQPKSAKPPAGQRKRHIPMLLIGAGSLLILGAIAGTAVLLSGVMSTAATKQHLRLTHRLLDLGLEYSVKAKAEDIAVPPLDAPGMQQRGAACYDAHCARCHGAPGVAPDAAALGMMPVPANLSHAARNQRPDWLYYVTRKGVRMTGMPAWEYRLSEDSLWSIVAFLETLPRHDATSYRASVDASAHITCETRSSLPAPREGAEVLLRQYGCHSCHVIEGVVGPRVDTGPPLVDWRRRAFIAGVLPNTPDNLVRWISDPRAVSPQTLMPDLGVAPEHARRMADFLLAAR